MGSGAHRWPRGSRPCSSCSGATTYIIPISRSPPSPLSPQKNSTFSLLSCFSESLKPNSFGVSATLGESVEKQSPIFSVRTLNLPCDLETLYFTYKDNFLPSVANFNFCWKGLFDFPLFFFVPKQWLTTTTTKLSTFLLNRCRTGAAPAASTTTAAPRELVSRGEDCIYWRFCGWFDFLFFIF